MLHITPKSLNVLHLSKEEILGKLSDCIIPYSSMIMRYFLFKNALLV